MMFDNREEYKKINISKLGLSTRTFNCLMRAGFNTLYLLVENYEVMPTVRNMGAKGITEIDELLYKISQEGVAAQGITVSSKDGASAEETIDWRALLPEEILSRPISDLHISVRIYHSFQSEGIETIGQALTLTPEEIRHMRNMGTLSAQQLQEQLDLLREIGNAYFVSNNETDEDASHSPLFDKREMDIETTKVLQENYGLKTAWLCEWYGLSRQGIYNKLAKRFNKGNWRNKELLSEERLVITGMINEKKFFFEQAGVKYYLLNNMEDNCAYLIVSDVDIKCFFLADLPEALQARIRMQNLHRFSEAECAALDTLGKTVFVLKKQHFMPNDSYAYRNLANARGLSTDEYSMFLFGLPFCPANVSITDDRIIAFLKKIQVMGRHIFHLRQIISGSDRIFQGALIIPRNS